MHARTSRPRLAKILWALVAVLLIATAVLQNQAIADWWKLRGYDPPAAVVQLADDTTMTSKARHLFYLNHPGIEAKSAFANNCPSGTEKTIVLGCYKSGENGMYILSVSDPRLHGVEQVTAAHETLHAAYNRLSAKDKNYVNGLLENYYQHDLTDQRIKATLKAYQTSEPGEQLNEMHSIFGTEVANLPAPLETYYKQYFTNRSKVAAYAAQYQFAFTSRQAQVSKDDAQLAAWKKQITTDEAALNSQQAALAADEQRLNTLRTSGNVSAYNAAVPAYNAKVDAYNTLLATAKQLVGQYNRLVNARNAIATEETQLQQALSGSLSPIGQQ